MRGRFIIVLLFLVSCSAFSQSKIKLTIRSVPGYTNPNEDLYIAGNFNSWNPKHNDSKFEKENGGYEIKLKLDNGLYEYKITRGSWDKVESKKGGFPILNRILKVEDDAEIEIEIE